jgi:hypothetical protein
MALVPGDNQVTVQACHGLFFNVVSMFNVLNCSLTAIGSHRQTWNGDAFAPASHPQYVHAFYY